MKLFVVLSVLAYGYAAKLDRTYLPPVSAATAGGSPGAITAPIQSGSGLQQDHTSTGLQPEFNQPESGFRQGSVGNQPGLNDFVSSTNGALNGNRYVMPNNAYESISKTDPAQIKNSQNYNAQDLSNYNQDFIQESGPNIVQAYTPERPQAAADRNAEILRYINENNLDSYNYNYETSNGISAEEAGEASNGVRAQGAYSYTGDDGNLYSITYTADENGFQPQGDHLPTPHPIPEEILKSIEENARAAAAGTQEGAYRPEEYESEISQQQHDTGLSGLNRPVGDDYSSSHNFQKNQGQVKNRPQGNQYSLGQDEEFGPKNDQADLQGFLTNKQSGFDNSQSSDRQREGNNGYKYNQPQNDFGSFVHSQETTPGFSSGNIPNLRSSTQYQAQSNINTRNQAPGQDDSFNQGQNTPFVTSKTSPQIGFDNSQTTERQGYETNGYKYNQPQIQKETSYPGSNSALLSGNNPYPKSYTQYQDQFMKHSGNKAPSQDDSFKQGQNTPFVTSKTLHQIRHNPQSGFDNGQTLEKQGHESNGYKYNQPQNDFQSFVNGQGSSGKEIQKEISYPISNSALLTGNTPHLKSYTHPIVPTGNQALSKDDSFNRGQNTQFETIKTSHQVPHKTQGSNGNQQFGSTIPSGEGYQYQPISNQKTLNYNVAVSDGSGNRGGFLNGQGNQNQNGNKEYFDKSGQHTLPFNQNGNQPIVGTNVPENQESNYNASKGSQRLPEIYQYNAPDQASRNQDQSFKNSGSNGSNVKQGSEQFGGPRQPPSYTPEGGYKY